MFYAQLDSNNICSCVSQLAAKVNPPQPNMIEISSMDETLLGKKWDGVSFVAVTPVIQPKRTLTKLEYMERFTDIELAGIYTAAKTVVSIEIWLEKFKLATEINLDDPATIAGLQAMEAAGLLVPGRAMEICA